MSCGLTASPRSRLVALYTRIAGQLLAPQTSAKWMRQSRGTQHFSRGSPSLNISLRPGPGWGLQRSNVR
eukprot:6639580-Pyramimonas_sp.AAC.1